MTQLLDQHGKPWRSTDTKNFKKASAPILGEAFGNWGTGRGVDYTELPGGGVLQFDLSRLTLADYRMMSSHYQINSSLSVLAFMLHQLQYTVECSNPRISSFLEENMRDVWTRLVRAFSQSFWSGFSPNVLQWDNDVTGRRVILDKIKDLAPEECVVNWKQVDGALPANAPTGAVPPKQYIYDGIKQFGSTYPIPKDNTVWYPLLMSNGNYYGRKLLKYAFQPWYFSTLMHLYSNRYFERFGEPVPVGRAPGGDQVDIGGGKTIDANAYMLEQLAKIRSRSAVVLPSDKQTDSSGDLTSYFDYDIQYLESQMRGADFERYMTRLDEEISLALFTPLLLMRTADVGSYNLGVSHMQMYLWQLNALADDWAEYINKYILSRLVDYNFGINAPRAYIKFYKMGRTQAETNRAVLSSLVSSGGVKVDLTELGHATGLTLEEIQEITEPQEEVVPDENDDREARVRDDKTRVSDGIIARLTPQAEKAFRNGTFGVSWEPDFGFTSKVSSDRMTALTQWNNDLLSPELFDSASEYMSIFSKGIGMILDD